MGVAVVGVAEEFQVGRVGALTSHADLVNAEGARSRGHGKVNLILDIHNYFLILS